MAAEATADDEFIDLRQLIRKLWTRRWWMAASIVAFGAASAVYAFTTDRVFRAATVLAPAESRAGEGALSSVLGEAGGLAALAGLDLGGEGANTEEALAVLRSRDFTLRFFEAHDVVQRLFADDWDAAKKQWKGGEPPSRGHAFTIFDKRVRRVIQNRKTGLVTLEIDWTDRNEAALWANELVRMLNEEMRSRAKRDADNSLAYLEKELAGTSVVETRVSINRLIEAQIKQRMLANVNHEYAFRVIDKAVAPEADEPVRPRRRNIVAVGLALGLIFGALCIVLADYFRREQR